MKIEFQPVQIAHPSDTDGRLIFADGRFAGLLSKLSDQHAENAGRWFLEFGLGSLSDQDANFADLNEVERWITQRMAA